MKFHFDSDKKIFSCGTPEMCYAFAVTEDGRIQHLHCGAPVSFADDLTSLIGWGGVRTPQAIDEYPCGEPFDFSSPCIRVTFPDGAQTVRLQYTGYSLENDRLIVILRDSFYPLEVQLIYSGWGDLPLLGRRAVITNLGTEKLTLDSAKSAAFTLPRGYDWRLTHFSGNWAAEYSRQQQMLTQSRTVLETSYLTEAACHEVPFFALDADGASTETSGEVYFGMLSYSGDYQICMETQYGKLTSVTGGVSDFTSKIDLAPGESFETPLFTAGFSSRGFEHMSEILYDWQYDYLLPRGKTYDKAHGVRPIIYNSWYPFAFRVEEQPILDLIPKAKYVGAELFVVDDGWMKGRTDSTCGLGDWVIDSARFPHGLSRISDECHRAGLKFGLWVEPEMVNPDSDLYRSHPDWVLSEPNRPRTLRRSQCILDFSRNDIRDWAVEWLDRLITDAKLDYLKWDMNRVVSETGLYARERGTAVRYMQNIRYIWKHLNERFPDLLLENCASGGGRADFGMVEFADRMNRSDNSDPVDVMLMHEGFSTLYVPKTAGGAGNIAPSPHTMNDRVIPLDFRILSGMTGSMSIGINLLKSSQEELDALREGTAEFVKLRPALQDSYVYRLASAAEHPYSVLEYCRRDQSEVHVFAFGHGMRLSDSQSMPRFRLRNLIPDAVYESDGQRMSGAALMSIGIEIPLKGDYAAKLVSFRKI